MKKFISKLTLILAIIVFAYGCQEEYPIVFDSSSSVVGFSQSALTMKENDESGSIKIYLGGVPDLAATDVTLEVSTDGISVPAIEGVDFTVSAKSVNVGVGEKEVTISPIDNTVFQGNKQFKLVIASNSKSYPISAQKSVTVTITDDEHPLKSWIGTYKVQAASYGSPGAWDEEWTVTTTPVAGKTDQLSILGIGNGSTIPLIATLDKENLTIKIESAQALGEAYGTSNGPVSLYYGTPSMLERILAEDYINANILSEASEIPMLGTLEINGTIRIDKMGLVLTDYDWAWDIFNTTWTKQ